MADAFNTSVPGTDLAPKRPIRAVRARFGSVRVPPANLGAWHRFGLVQQGCDITVDPCGLPRDDYVLAIGVATRKGAQLTRFVGL